MPAINRPKYDRLELGLGTTGLIALAGLTFHHPASSVLHLTPWRYATVMLGLAAAGLLVLRLTAGPVWLRPSLPWLGATLALLGSILLSAANSPFPGVVLGWAVPVLAALALFLWLQIRLHDPGAKPGSAAEFTARLLALGGGFLALVSAGHWGFVALRHFARDRPIAALFDLRNAYPLGHSNYTAGAMVLSLPWLVLAAHRSAGRVRFLWAGLAALAVFVLFTSGSRGGLVGLAALAVAATLSLRLPARRLIPAAIAVALGLVALVVLNPRVRALLPSSDAAQPPSISAVQRSAMVHAGIAMGKDRPLLGWGLHATPLIYPRYRGRLEGGAENVLQLHNTPLEIAAGLGLGGVAAAGALLALALRGWRRHPTAACALVGVGAFALTDYPFDLPWFAVVLAAVVALLAPPPNAQPSRALRWGLLATLLGTVLVLIVFARRDATPFLNTSALHAAQDGTPEGRRFARHNLEASLNLNPDQEIAHFNLGWLLVIEDPMRAAFHFDRAAELVPDKGGVYFGRALTALNQGDPAIAAHFLAVECLNDPAFAGSPWWTVPGLTDLREPTRLRLAGMLGRLTSGPDAPAPGSWLLARIKALQANLPRLGELPPGPERAYRRERTGYPVLSRNHDLAPPVDLFDVRESPAWLAASLAPLPPKGWLPNSSLRRLRSATTTAATSSSGS